MSPRQRTDGSCCKVDAPELTDTDDLDDLADLMLGNLIVAMGNMADKSSTVNRTAACSATLEVKAANLNSLHNPKMTNSSTKPHDAAECWAASQGRSRAASIGCCIM